MVLKTFISRAITVGLLACLSSSPSLLQAQGQPDLKALPIDPKVTMGTLSNGLTYYIRPNGKPEKKVELRLALNVGSILENDDQQGLAHFMEHMNFNGTKNYPKNELVDFLQSIGVQFGADLNAHTSFDETLYILPIPTDKPGNLEKGFQVLGDWAHNANLAEEDIDAERGVVLEESRGSKGAQDRMARKYLPKLLANSRYADRLPIGKDDILKSFKYQTLRDFYNDWYRPDLMAVAVVGDITVEEAKALIEKYFGSIENPSQARERKEYVIEPYGAASAMVVTDKEATNYLFQLQLSARKAKTQVMVEDYRGKLVEQIFNQLLNKRFQELSQSATPPFVAAYGYNGSFIRGYENFSLIVVPSTDIPTGINAAIAELVKAEQFGFQAAELELVKKQLMSSIEKSYNERNTTESAKLVEEYVRNFLDKEPIPGIEKEYSYFQEMLPSITLEEVNVLTKKWLNQEAFSEYFTLITGPDSRQMKVPTDMELKEIVTNALQQKVTANAEKVVADKLLDQEPKAGKIVSENKDAELGTTTYTLSNGVLVTIKPTDFKSDEIILTAVKKGGTSNYAASDKSNVSFISPVIEAMGYGQFTPTALTDALSGKTVSLAPQMSDISNGLKGSAAVGDVKSLTELIYLQLTQPRKDEGLFQGFITNMNMQLQFLGANPQMAFIDTLGKSLYDNDPLRPIMVPTAADIQKIDMDRVLEIYKNEFGNADGFHFFIVGNVAEATIKPLLEQYIASLPVKGTPPAFKDNGLRPVSGNHRLDFYKGSEAQSLIMAQYYGTTDFSESLALKANMLAEVLNIIVIEEMREKMSAIYSGGMGASLERDPYANYTFQLYLPCGPESVAPLLQEMEKEITNLKTTEVDAKNLDKVKLAIIEQRKEAIKTNNYWSAKLEQLLFWKYDKQRFLNTEQLINQVTAADLKDAANLLFDGKNTFIGVLYPEKK